MTVVEFNVVQLILDLLFSLYGHVLRLKTQILNIV